MSPLSCPCPTSHTAPGCSRLRLSGFLLRAALTTASRCSPQPCSSANSGSCLGSGQRHPHRSSHGSLCFLSPIHPIQPPHCDCVRSFKTRGLPLSPPLHENCQQLPHPSLEKACLPLSRTGLRLCIGPTSFSWLYCGPHGPVQAPGAPGANVGLPAGKTSRGSNTQRVGTETEPQA